MTSAASMFAPVAAPTGLPIRLAMQRLWLTGEVLPAGARLTVEHVFQSDEDHPLEVIYPFPLPRDAALRRFRIAAGSCETHSELVETAEAVKAYEQGIEQGSLSALARQYGDGLVNLTVGNIRPRETVTVHVELLAGVELRDDGFRFRFPFTLAPSYHSQMRAVTAGGGVELELPAGFGDLLLPPFLEDASSLHQVGFALSVRHGAALGEIGSPSHAIRVAPGPAGLTRVTLAPEKDVPDRDLVLDVRFSEDTPQVLSGPSGDGKRAFAIVVPSSRFGSRTEQARRVAILLDRSGSMSGEPIAQARKAVEACLASLSEQDEFLLVAFDDRVETAHAQPVPATREHREAARAFLRGIGARGGTELASAVEQAARALGAGDIFLITDGQVFGTETILAEARSAGARLSCLGIGSASQDRFLSLLARETGGVSRFVTPRERVDLAAIDLFAALGRPLASGLRAAHVEPEPPPVVFAGTPVLLFGEVEADSAGHIDLAWDGGSMSFTVPPGAPETGETVRLLRGSRLITDWESRHASADAPSPLEKRQQKRVAARLLQLSRRYGLASREMSLVAVVKREGDRSGELPETRVVPVGVPQDTEISMEAFLVSGSLFSVDPEPALGKTRGRDAAAVALAKFDAQPPATESAAGGADLIDLASMLEPDGGMPGDSPEARAARTVAAVLAFVAGGHTLRSGAFRRHLARLVEFLKALSAAPETDARLIATALDAAETGHAPGGPWLSLACDPGIRTIADGCGSVLSASEQDHVRSYWNSIKNMLPDWRSRYQWPQGIDRETSVKNRNDLENAIRQDLEELSCLRKTTFDAVLEWGFGRSSNLSETDIALSTRSAFEHLRSGRLAEAARALCELRGVGISRASKILALSDQRELAIYDSRAAHGLRKLVDHRGRRLVPIPPGRVIRRDNAKDFNQAFQRYICVLRLLRECARSDEKLKGQFERLSDLEMAFFMGSRIGEARDVPEEIPPPADLVAVTERHEKTRFWTLGSRPKPFLVQYAGDRVAVLTGEQFQTASKMLTPQHIESCLNRFGEDWFPLSNNKEREKRRKDGLGHYFDTHFGSSVFASHFAALWVQQGLLIYELRGQALWFRRAGR